jgi:hypothetical protein
LCVINYFGFFQGLHPRIITEGFDKARAKTLEVLERLKIKVEPTRANLLDVARTSLRTKIHQQLADVLTDVSVVTGQLSVFIHLKQETFRYLFHCISSSLVIVE